MVTMEEIRERLATLEQQQKQQQDASARQLTIMDGQAKDIRELRNDVAEIKSQMRGFKSFGAGMLFAFSGMWAILGGAAAIVYKKLFGG